MEPGCGSTHGNVGQQHRAFGLAEALADLLAGQVATTLERDLRVQRLARAVAKFCTLERSKDATSSCSMKRYMVGGAQNVVSR